MRDREVPRQRMQRHPRHAVQDRALLGVLGAGNDGHDAASQSEVGRHKHRAGNHNGLYYEQKIASSQNH